MQTDTKNINDAVRVIDTIKMESSNKIELSPQLSQKIDSYLSNQQGDWMDFILPTLSILIALLALYISKLAYDHGKRHSVISLKPLLIFREETSHRTGKIRLYIANKGVGPLTFLDFNLEYEGHNYGSMYPIFDNICKKFGYTRKDFKMSYRTFTNPLVDYSLKIDEEKSLIKYCLTGRSFKESEAFFNEFKKITFSFRYCDLYDNVVSNDYTFKS